MFKKQPFISFNSTYPKLIDIFPEPEPASKNLPSWYKQQPAYFNNDKTVINGSQKLTVKKCIAFFDVVSSGYILKCPVDIHIDTTQEKPVFEISPQFNQLKIPLIANHSMEQVSHYPIDKENELDFLLRINMVWVISTSKNYSCLFLNPQHHDSLPIKAVSAIIDTDEFYSDGLFSFIVKKGFKGIIKKGTPLVQVIPFKRESWTSTINQNFDVNNELRHQRYKIRTMFSGGYKKYFWKKKVYK